MRSEHASSLIPADLDFPYNRVPGSSLTNDRSLDESLVSYQITRRTPTGDASNASVTHGGKPRVVPAQNVPTNMEWTSTEWICRSIDAGGTTPIVADFRARDGQ